MHIMNRLFAAWEAEGIRYIHFKSNRALGQSFAGRGDFDVLADRDRVSDAERVLTSLGAKRFNKPRYGVYPGVDNWLLFDGETGGLYHLHLHYQIASGKPYLKEYIIPWSEALFATRVRDGQTGIYISLPEMELLLLTVRAVIKSRCGDWVKARVGAYRMHASLREERQELLSRVDPDRVLALSRELFRHVSPEAVTAVSLKADWDGWNFRQATKLIRRELAVWRRFSPAGSQARAIGLFLGDGWNKFARRKLGKCRVEKKVTLSGGRIIAFVGVDGAGKSTVKDEIYRWMGKQIESRRFYMGTGDGKVNPVARLLKKGARKLAGAPSSGAKAPQTDRPAPAPISFRKSPMGYLKKVMAGVMVSSVERDNERKMKAMNRYRLAGGVSLLDRYPQIELAGKNDGPKIAGYRARVDRSRLLDRLAQKEERRLALVREIRPDLIFRLNISAETSMARKPEQQDIETFRGKIQELRQITFQGARIVDIDAEQPFERELLEIKRIIWESF